MWRRDTPIIFRPPWRKGSVLALLLLVVAPHSYPYGMPNRNTVAGAIIDPTRVEHEEANPRPQSTPSNTTYQCDPKHPFSVFFLHIPRSGGSKLCSFAQLLGSKTARREVDGGENCNPLPWTIYDKESALYWTPDEQRAWMRHHRYDFFASEFGLPLKMLWDPCTVRYLVSIREPRNRIVSMWKAVCGALRNETNWVRVPYYPEVSRFLYQSQGCDPLGTFIQRWIDNEATRYLCGARCATVPSGQLTAQDFRRALHHIHRLDLVTVLELQPFMAPLVSALDWDPIAFAANYSKHMRLSGRSTAGLEGQSTPLALFQAQLTVADSHVRGDATLAAMLERFTALDRYVHLEAARVMVSRLLSASVGSQTTTSPWQTELQDLAQQLERLQTALGSPDAVLATYRAAYATENCTMPCCEYLPTPVRGTRASLGTVQFLCGKWPWNRRPYWFTHHKYAMRQRAFEGYPTETRERWKEVFFPPRSHLLSKRPPAGE